MNEWLIIGLLFLTISHLSLVVSVARVERKLDAVRMCIKELLSLFRDAKIEVVDYD